MTRPIFDPARMQARRAAVQVVLEALPQPWTQYGLLVKESRVGLRTIEVLNRQVLVDRVLAVAAVNPVGSEARDFWLDTRAIILTRTDGVPVLTIDPTDASLDLAVPGDSCVEAPASEVEA